MRRDALAVYRCPQCFDGLVLSEEDTQASEVWRGRLTCVRCGLDYPIAEGMAFFGVEKAKAAARQREIEAEFEWNFVMHDIDAHLEYGATTFSKANSVIRHIKNRFVADVSDRIALDAGAGRGELSYLLARHGFRTIAVELGAEHLAVGEVFSRAAPFERGVSDTAVLPFGDSTFDVAFCKSVLHHIEDLATVLGEIRRVVKPDGVIVVMEPYKQRFTQLLSLRKGYDRAKEIGLSHQDYSLTDYLNALDMSGWVTRELSVAAGFRGRRHPRLVGMYRLVEQMVGARHLGSNRWLVKKIIALLFESNGTIIAENSKQSSWLGKRSNMPREIALLSPDRLVRFCREIESMKSDADLLSELLNEIYEARNGVFAESG